MGSEDTVKTINVARETEFSSFLGASNYGARRFGADSSKVRDEVVLVRRLDGVLAEIVPVLEARRPFLKLDTQGYDLEVLKGLGDNLGCFCAIEREVSVVPIYEGMPHWIARVLISSSGQDSELSVSSQSTWII